MASSYKKLVNAKIAFKLHSELIFSISTTSNEWFKLLQESFWETNFVRNFGSKLPEGSIYTLEYLTMENLPMYKLLLYIIKKNYIELLTYMLSKWKAEGSLLVESVKLDKYQVIKLLLANGVDIHYQEDLAFRTAAELNNLYIIKLLWLKGANLSVHNNITLINAYKNRQFELLITLLDCRANINALVEPGKPDPSIARLFNMYNKPYPPKCTSLTLKKTQCTRNAANGDFCPMHSKK